MVPEVKSAVSAGWSGARGVVVAGALVAGLAGCSEQPQAVAPPVQIPTILAPTTVVRTPVMVDRELLDDCELIVPVEKVNARIGREVQGEVRTIVGIPEPSVGRTAKVDCYYDLAERQPLSAAPLIIGLATYADDGAARDRVVESITAERAEGGTVSEVEVGKQKASVVSTAGERLLIGSLGKSTFVARAKVGFVPDDQVNAVLAALAVQAMTPIEDA
ncbi:hypothetical protein [Actinosynnema sp. NPDC023587]|uniref:hypothetical protein n=1 Tax=Actinosynnema sp. NPDC023587 TaxID=3154695 RepID=UPI0033C5E9B0